MKKLTILFLLVLFITPIITAQIKKQLAKDFNAEKEKIYKQEYEKEQEKRTEEIRKEYEAKWEKEFEERNKSNLKSGNSAQVVDKNDSLALVALYNATDGPNWKNNDNWLKGPVNTWRGVYIDNGFTIYLAKNNLNGKIPDEFYNLSNLKSLWLSDNNIIGGIISGIGNFNKLERLSLYGTNLKGEIPPEIGNCESLIEIYLPDSISGKIPPEIGKMVNMESLNLTCNFTGEIPKEIGNLPKLRSINLNGNNLTGDIPKELGNLMNLRDLSLGTNNLSGPIPKEICYLNLYTLNLQGNNISGNIPPEIENLTNLTRLQLGANNLTGEIPMQLGNLEKLKGLYLRRNELTGNIPEELSNLKNLRDLDLMKNDLGGQIPNSFENMPELYRLYLSNNRFTFSDLEPIFSWNNFNNIQIYFYEMQKVGKSDTLYQNLNDNVILSILNYEPGTADNYQWYKDRRIIEGATSLVYEINSMTEQDTGIYYCKITNDIVTGLTLESHPITLKIGEAETYKIYGKVTHGKKPIEGAVVCLYNNGKKIKTCITDEEGKYSYNSLYNGLYWLRVDEEDNGFSKKEGNRSRAIINDADVRVNFQLLYDLKFLDDGYHYQYKEFPFTLKWEVCPGASSYKILYHNDETLKFDIKTSNSNFYQFEEDILDKRGFINTLVIAFDVNNNFIGVSTRRDLFLYNKIVAGEITENTTWEGNIALRNKVHVPKGVALTINPNTRILLDTINSDQENNFALEIEGKLEVNGQNESPVVIFQRYNRKKDGYGIPIYRFWKGIKFLNSKEDNSLNFLNLYNVFIGLEINNSALGTIKNSNFRTSGTYLISDNSSFKYEYCKFGEWNWSMYQAIFKNNANPSFNQCWFSTAYDKKNTFYLENTPNNIEATHCKWSRRTKNGIANIVPMFYDYYTTPSLGKVLIEPVIMNAINFSKGAEDVELVNNINKSGEIISDTITSEPIRVIGNPDGMEFFLKQSKSIILDMGEDGDIVNGDSTDVLIFARNYSNVDTGFVYVEISLSQNKEDWEELGIIQDFLEFDISELEFENYRYVKISNYSPTFTENDTIGIFLDAVISVHDENVFTSVPKFEYVESSTTLFSNFPNPFTNETSFTINLPNSGEVKMAVYNLFGQQVDLVDYSYQMQGTQELIYQSKSLQNGTYIAKLFLNDAMIGTGKLLKME